MREKMTEDGSIADSSLGPQLGDRAVWDMDSADHECDCPGPPPKFYLPPPPRPSSFVGSDCSENSISDVETCEAVPVIDAEYHFSPALPSLAIILIVVIAVVVFLFIGTLLVLLKKRSVHNLFPRKSSPQQNRCDSAIANGMIYEDLGHLRVRPLPPHCPPGRSNLANIEMMDVSSYPSRVIFGPVFMCPTSSVHDSTYHSQDLFNPVYEELSNGSGERGETDSEGIPQAPVSEDEFAEDELSVGGEVEGRGTGKGRSGGSLRGFLENDSSDADDKSKFLENPEKMFSLPVEFRDRGRKGSRGTHFHGASGRPKSLDRRKPAGRSKVPASPTAAPADCAEFHEGLLLKKILQIYPDATGQSSPYSSAYGPPCARESSTGAGQYQSLAGYGQAQPRRHKPEIFTTFKAIPGSAENQSQDSLGSDSGYSNNTSGGNASRGRKDCRLADRGNPVLAL